MREAGWAKEERNRLFEAILAQLKAAGSPATPLPHNYKDTQTLILKGPNYWIRYFVWALPSRNELSVGLYIPKGKYGVAVHEFLLKEKAALSTALGGGPVLQHKEVQREFRHFVRRKHWFGEDTVGDAVQWCVAGLSGSRNFVKGSTTLRDGKALRESKALHDRLVAPTDDPTVFDAAVATLLAEDKVERPAGNLNPLRRPTPAGDRFVRDPKVAAFVLQRAGYSCEGCGTRPFQRDDGSHYLEVHHLQRLADLGPDTVRNAVAVCPNCHRLLHYGRTRKVLAGELQKKAR